MRTVLPLLLCGLSLLIAMSRAEAASRTLLLDLWLDGKDQERVASVTLTDGHIWLAADDLAALHLGLVLPPPGEDGRTDLSAITDLKADLNESEQRLDLSVPPRALPRQLYDLSHAGHETAETSAGASGAVLHYDLSASTNDASVWGRNLLGGGAASLDIFTPDVLIQADGFLSATSAGWHAARLDSSVILDDPESLRHISLGDAITTMPAFARPVRFGGVEFSRDFSLRPDLDTRPLPQFFGQTAVPATVDVFSGAAKVFEQKIEPGPFALNNLPVVSGGGAATIVTTDVLGRQTTQTLSLYTQSDLLAPGIFSYAVDAGFLRTNYGISSLGYDTPILSASARSGITGVTLESHGEASPHLALVSGGAALGLGSFGAVSGDIAASGSAAGHGMQVSFNAHARAGPLNFFAAGSSASAAYRDLASLDTPTPLFRYQLGATASLARAGTIGMSWITGKYPGSRTSGFLSASWTLALPRGMFLAASGLRDLQNDALSAQISLAVPLGGRELATLSGAAQNGAGSGLALYDNPADPDGGFGYRLLTGWQDGGRLEGDGTYIGPHFSADAGVSLASSVPALRGDLDGALVLMQDRLFAVHDPGGAVALVQTGDPGVRVFRENRAVAVSDAQGEALITGLNPYAPNHIGVDPRDFAFDTLVEKTDVTVAPPRQGGVLVNLKPVSRHPLLAMVTAEPGVKIPLGAKVLLDGQDGVLAVGHDGEIFIADLDHPVGAEIDLGGSRCRFFITPEKNSGPMPRTAPILCLRESASVY